MKILFSSYSFAPNIGGLELVSELLCREWAALGDDVTLITDTPYFGMDSFPFRVIRRPDWRTLARLFKWCEIFYHNHLSLKYAWPALLGPDKPWVVSLQTYLSAASDEWKPIPLLKKLVIKRAYRIALNQEMGRRYQADIVLPSPYDERVFRLLPEVKHDRDIIFVGRLVSDKGAETLIKALMELRAAGWKPTTSIAGAGPEENRLKSMVESQGMNDQITFLGSQKRTALVPLFNRHRLMVIPSLWAEPFGVVALEGIACGCIPIGSNIGGIPDAIGKCGVLFEPGNSGALARAITALLTDEGLQSMITEEDREKHLGLMNSHSLAIRFKSFLEKVAHA